MTDTLRFLLTCFSLARKEIVLDLAEIAGGAGISDQLVDFGVVGQDNPPLYLWLIRDKRN